MAAGWENGDIRIADWEEWKRHPQDTQGGCLVDDMYDVKIMWSIIDAFLAIREIFGFTDVGL